MISLEMAKKLKAAGLEWEPQIGDMFYWHNGKDWGIDALTSEDVNNNLDETRDFIDEGAWIFAPCLDQLLAKISKTEWKWLLFGVGGIWLERKNEAQEIIHDGPLEEGCLTELTASALLWIYEGGAKV